MLTLKIRSSKDQSLHTMQIDPQISVADLCRNIEQYLPKAMDHDASEFGLFVRDQQQSNRSYWLDPTKTMNYYQLKNNDEIEYKNRYRQLKIRLLDGTVKTILIDDSLIVAQLMVYICTKFGIANYEEYSLVYDLDHGENQQNTKTLTLRRDRSLQRTDKKMEELRKKCHTDDDTLWLDQSKTLRQQDIDEQSTVVLRRKFFFSDTNIDQRDPVQLNLLYVQCRNGIIDGTHPVTLDEAVQFSGFQCQIEFGDFHESQHKSGVFDLKEFLPKEYLKVKNIDKRIVSEHKKHLGLCELDGKMKYTHLCRSLRTYGVTFFLVKEKLSGKHKLVPRLLGVTKESIVRVDERTKDFLQVWPLTHVKRWTASPNTFTLDFGDYATAYYSVQTNDGQQISQLIAGYIDIILKKRKDRDDSDRNGMTDDEATAIEDVIAPGKATIIQPNRATFGFVHQQAVQSPPLIRGTFSDVVRHSPHSTSESQDEPILMSSIQNARTTNQSIRSLLNGNIPLSSLITQSSMHSELNRQLLSQNLATLNASIAQIINSTSDISPRHSLDNHPALINGITTLNKTFDEFVKEIHRAEANFLVERLHRFSSIFDDLLNSIENFLKNERDLTSKQNIPQLCSRLGEINEEILRQIDPKFDTTVDYREKLLVVSKSVANTTAVYVLKGKEIAGNINESTLINEIISRATQCALATSQLVACTKIVAPTISNPLCQEQLIESTRNVTRSIEFLLQTCCSSSNIDEHFQNDLTNAARTVRQNLNEFLLQIKVFTEENVENPIEEIFSASDRLFSSMGDANEMLKQTKILAQSTADLVSSLREKAESTHDDSNQQQKFLSAAKLLADATAKMVESAKICAAKPNDSQVQYQLKKSVEELRLATQMASNYQNCRKVFQRLEQNAKVCGTVATQFIAVTSATSTKNRNQHGHQQLVQQCKIVADLIPKVVQAIRMFKVQTDSWPLQMHFLHICEDFLGPTRYLAELGQSAVSAIDDTVLAAQLDQSSRHLLETLIDLRSSATKGQELCASVPVDIETISQAIELFDRELNELQQQIQNGTFKPLPNENFNSSNQFTSLCHQLKTHLCQLLDAFTRKDEKFVETSSRTIYSIVRDFVNATRQLVVKSHPEVSTQDALIQRSRQYVQRVISILHDGEKVLINPSDGQRMKKLSDEIQEFVTILNSSRETNFSHRHFDDAMKKMSEYVFSLAGPFERKSSLSTTHSEKLNRAADQLNQATNDLVKTTGQTSATQDLVKNSTRFSQAFGDFIQNSLDYVHQQDEEEKRSHLIIRLKNVHVISNQFLEQAKSASVEPMLLEKNHKQHLADAARAVTETIQEVISACLVTNSKSASLTSGRFEFEQILRDLEASKILLDESHRRPCANFTYFEALDNVVDNSKRLGEAMTHIASAAKNVNQQLFHQAVQDASRAVCQLVEASAQANYLITISNNYPGEETSALIDESVVNQSVLTIRKACANLSNSSIERNEILSLAAIIAKNTSILCNLSRDVSTQTTDSTIRRKFVQSAKDVANSTAELVRMIKIFDQSYTSEHHRQCIESSQPLLKSLDELYQCATSKELSNISTDQRQESILLATRQVVDGVCRIIECSKILIVNSKEASLWQQLATHTKTVSESIKRLATSVKDLAPGQQECEKSIERLRKLFQHVDQALTNPITQRKTDKTLQFHQQNIKSTIQPLFELIDRLRQSAKRYSERLGTYVYQYLNSFESMISQTIDFVSFFTEFSKRTFVLEKSKSLVELSLQFLLSCKESGGNIKHLQWHRVLDQNVDQLVDSIEKFVQTIDETGRNPFDDKIRQFDQIVVPDLGNFGDYQTRMIEILREISRTLHEKMSFETIRSTLIVQYDELIHSTAGTIHSSMTKDLAQKIKQSVIELGANLNEFVDNFNEHHTDLDHFAQRVREKIAQILSLLQINLRGTQACHQATNTISNIISDLDTTIRSASTNSLTLVRKGETFADHREAILKTAKALVEDTKTLVAAAAASQDQLAMAAQAAVRTMTKLSDVVKTGATPVDLHDGPIQVMLISSVKDVALALNNLINVTKAASGKPIDHPEMKQLKESAKIMVMNVTSLLRTVKTIEDKAQQGKNALEITIESIGHQLEFYPEENRSTNLQVTPEDLILVTKQITTATSKAVSAGQSAQQDEIIVAANLGRKATTDLLDICKSSLDRTHDRVLQQRLLENGRQCVKSYQDLLETIRQMIDQPTIEHKQKLVQHSRSIAQTIQSLVQCAELWKSLTIDHDDPADVAEQELFHAAQSIESAAKKLSSLKPRRTVQEIDPDLNFDEQILDAAKSIMNAVSALITAATAAQKELVEQGKFSNNSNTNDDGQWSEGLISAARYVALSCQVLCDAANGLVQGNESEEKLISCATQVSSTTAALLVACKVKADFMSKSMTRLQTAGNTVKRAADTLVRAAQQAVEMHQEEKQIELSTRFVPGLAEEIQCKEAILTKERELDQARHRLKAIRLAKYGHQESESNESN